MKAEAGLALGGRYRLVRRIAVGGMGEVWVASDQSLGRDVAVKLLRAEYAGEDDFLNRLRVEARNSAVLSHNNIAQLYDYGEQNGSGYIVMELVAGLPLNDILERTPSLPTTRVLSILAQAARGLHAAHIAGVVHRDVKPGNILVQRNGEVKITDFGVSLAADQLTMTQTGMVMGTAQYLSPEQALGKPATALSDLYALGVVAYECVNGSRPFNGKTPVDIAVSQVNDPVPPLSKSIHPKLVSLIMRMLDKDPAKRPRNGILIAEEAEALLAELKGAEKIPLSLSTYPNSMTTTQRKPLTQGNSFSTPTRVNNYKSPYQRNSNGRSRHSAPTTSATRRAEPESKRRITPLDVITWSLVTLLVVIFVIFFSKIAFAETQMEESVATVPITSHLKVISKGGVSNFDARLQAPGAAELSNGTVHITKDA